MSSHSYGIFWDIQNVAIPSKITPDTIYSSIRSEIIEKIEDYPFIEYFYVVGSLDTLKLENVRRLQSIGATFEEAEPGKDVADNMLKQKMEKFLRALGFTVILISGDRGFVNTLKEFRRIFDAKIFVIYSRNCFDTKTAKRLDSVSDKSYSLQNDGTLVANDSSNDVPESKTKTFGEMYSEMFRGQFVKFSFGWKMFPPLALVHLRNDSRSGYGHVIYDDEVWAYFPEFYKTIANKSVYKLKGSYRFNSETFFMNVNIVEPPKAVVRLMACNDLRENKPKRVPKEDTLDMDDFINLTTELIETFRSLSNSMGTRPQSNRGPNEECSIS